MNFEQTLNAYPGYNDPFSVHLLYNAVGPAEMFQRLEREGRVSSRMEGRLRITTYQSPARQQAATQVLPKTEKGDGLKMDHCIRDKRLFQNL